MNRLADRPDGLREILDPMHARHIAGLEMDLRHAAVIALDEAIEDFRQKAPLFETEAAHDAEVHHCEASLCVDEQISLMHVGVEKSVPHRRAQEGLNDVATEVLQIIALRGERLDVGQRCSIDPFERQHLFRGPVPVDSRNPEILILRRILGEFGCRGGFEPEIHFHLDGAGQRIDDLDRLQAAGVVKPAFGEARREIHVAQVAFEMPLDARTQHLDGDFAFAIAVFHERPVNLGNRGGGDRLSETYKGAAKRFAEGGLDSRDRDCARKRRHPVLQKLELLNDGHADDVRPGREELAELDIGRPEPADRGGEIGKTAWRFAGGFGPGSWRTAPGKQSCQGEGQPRGRGQNRRIDVAEHAGPGQHDNRACEAQRGTEGKTQFPPVLTHRRIRRDRITPRGMRPANDRTAIACFALKNHAPARTD